MRSERGSVSIGAKCLSRAGFKDNSITLTGCHNTAGDKQENLTAANRLVVREVGATGPDIDAGTELSETKSSLTRIAVPLHETNETWQDMRKCKYSVKSQLDTQKERARTHTGSFNAEARVTNHVRASRHALFEKCAYLSTAKAVVVQPMQNKSLIKSAIGFLSL